MITNAMTTFIKSHRMELFEIVPNYHQCQEVFDLLAELHKDYRHSLNYSDVMKTFDGIYEIKFYAIYGNSNKIYLASYKDSTWKLDDYTLYRFRNCDVDFFRLIKKYPTEFQQCIDILSEFREIDILANKALKTKRERVIFNIRIIYKKVKQKFVSMFTFR